MGKKLFGGNLSDELMGGNLSDELTGGNPGGELNTDGLPELVASHGTIESATVLTDHAMGQGNDFGLVDRTSNDQAAAATEALDGQEHGHSQ